MSVKEFFKIEAQPGITPREKQDLAVSLEDCLALKFNKGGIVKYGQKDAGHSMILETNAPLNIVEEAVSHVNSEEHVNLSVLPLDQHLHLRT